MFLSIPLRRIGNQDYAIGRLRADGYNAAEEVLVIPETRETVLCEAFIDLVPGLKGRETRRDLPYSVAGGVPLSIDAFVAELAYRFGQQDEGAWTSLLSHQVYFSDAYLEKYLRRFMNRDATIDQNDVCYVCGVVGWSTFPDHGIEVLPWNEDDDCATFAVGDCAEKFRSPKPR